MQETIGHYQLPSTGQAVSSSSAQRGNLVPLLRRPPPPTSDSGRLRSGSSQPSAAPAMLLIRPVQLSRSSAMMAVNKLPPDRVVRTAVLQLANPTREPFFRAEGNQLPPLADAFFPSDEEGSQGEWGQQSGGRGKAKGLSWLQWLLANLLILLVAATVVLAVFGQRMFAASGGQAAVRTTAGFVLRPDAGLRKPPPFAPPPPTHREGEDAGRKRNLPPILSGGSTRRRTIHSFKKVTRSRKGTSTSAELAKRATDD
ncbi:uncharacterized protein LOC142572853 [Dermacentor variabilis]|uniref:uncharacterized protein LOC142572853 n=1 Tax=Dermacentor variabilis TaxID=34621 RepID=UPI003F5C67F1